MLQDIAPHVFENHYTYCTPGDGDIVMGFDGREVYVRSASGGFPRWGELTVKPEVNYGFSIDGVRYFMPMGAFALPDGFERMPLRTAQFTLPREEAFAVMTAYHLHAWHGNHRFCGRCAEPMVPDRFEQALRCSGCDAVIYPDIHPAVNVAITDGDRILLVRNANDTKMPFVLVAGFCEFGETSEQTVHREVMEEVGLRVGRLHAFGSQPWGMAGNLQIGYFAELEGTDEFRLDENEIRCARWFRREEVPTDLGTSSITGAMMDAFRRGVEREMWI